MNLKLKLPVAWVFLAGSVALCSAAENDSAIPYFSLPDAVAGSPYRYRIPIQNGGSPLNWSAHGELPPGISLNEESGSVEGTAEASATGNYRFAVEASTRTSPPETARIGYLLTIRPPALRILPPEGPTAAPPQPEQPVEEGRSEDTEQQDANSDESPGKEPEIRYYVEEQQKLTASYTPRNSERSYLSATRVELTAKPLGEPVTDDIEFRIVEEPTHGKLRKISEKQSRLVQVALFLPRENFRGVDRFRYAVFLNGKRVSNIATVAVDVVKLDGLRWDVVGGAATGLSSDGEGAGMDGDVLGKTLPDFLFRLDWFLKSPKRRGYYDPVLNSFTSNGETGLGQASAHFSFKTGFVTLPVAVSGSTTSEDSSTAGDGSAQTIPTGEAPPDDASADGMMNALTYQRAFTAGVEGNYNYVNSADRHGGFFEIGGVARASFDVFVDDSDFTMQDGVTFVRLSRPDQRRGFYRFETGFHFALKQSDEDETADSVLLRRPRGARIDSGGAADEPLIGLLNMPAGKGASSLYSGESGRRSGSTKEEAELDLNRNLEDLLVIEALYQRNDAFKGVMPTDPGCSLNRLLLRFIATPRIPPINAGKAGKFLIGMEYSRDFGGGPQDIRLFYGFNVALSRLF